MSDSKHWRVTQRRVCDVRFSATRVLHKAILACVLVLAGCVSSPPLDISSLGGTQPLVKIGLAAPFEGLDRPLGYEALAGVKLALAERNAMGGVGGYNIELVALNDFNEPKEARSQAAEFAADPAVLGVVTGWTEETARASLPAYQQAGLAVAVPWSVHPELADREAGVVLVAADEQRAALVLAGAVSAAHPSRLAVVSGGPSAAVYVDSMDDLQLDTPVIFPPDVLDGQITQEWIGRLLLDQSQTPDALVLATDGFLAGDILMTLAIENWEGTVFAGVETGSVHVVDIAGNAAAGLVYVIPAPAGRDLSRVGHSSVQVEDGLGPRGVLAYDATNVLLDAIDLAIQKDGYPSRQGIITTLPDVRRHGLTGDIAFDVTGRRIDAPVWLYKIVDSYPAEKLYPGQVLFSQR